MITTQYLSIVEVLELHRRTIEKHGGKAGVRDMGLLESALLRCQSGYYSSLSEQAASLLQSLSMNHCFVDGNKRVALLATVVFFKINNYDLKCSNKDIVSLIIDKVIIAKIDVQEISIWFNKFLVKRK